MPYTQCSHARRDWKIAEALTQGNRFLLQQKCDVKSRFFRSWWSSGDACLEKSRPSCSGCAERWPKSCVRTFFPTAGVWGNCPAPMLELVRAWRASGMDEEARWFFMSSVLTEMLWALVFRLNIDVRNTEYFKYLICLSKFYAPSQNLRTAIIAVWLPFKKWEI